jgi:nitroreductase
MLHTSTLPQLPVPARVSCLPGDKEAEDFACMLIASRQSISAKRLVEPGPDAAQLERILSAAAAAPDHGELTPWRFVIVPQDKRALLAEVFALALIDRDAGATLEQIESAREKAHRAPLLMLAVAQLGRSEPDIPAEERLVSLGCALQNMLLAAHSMGYGAGLTSGQAMNSPRLRALFRLVQGEHAVCWINVGSVTQRRPLRLRPAPAAIVSAL